jgi:eukaryotic-like serine/threonine-protein kinase
MNDSSASRKTQGIGQTFGAYTFYHILAEGGMGVIFEAEHSIVRRKVALKIVSPKYAAREGFSPQLIETFMHEARVMGAIDHPNVVTLYDAGVVGQCPYLAMKLVTGGDLQSMVLKHGTLRDDQALKMLLECASGLAAIHGAGFINRDIKPANILLEANGNPRISDFGVAVPTSDIPTDNLIAGTPSYLAPEQVHHQALDLRADIYSLGASFWYTLMGAPPFDGGSPEEILSLLMTASDAPPLPASTTPQGRGLRQIILHAMAFQPDKRYRTADEIVHDCQAVLAGGEPEYAHIGQRRKRSFLGSLLDRG